MNSPALPTRPASAPSRREGPVGRALAGERRALAACALFSGVSSVLLLVPSVYSMQIYDRVLSSRHGMTLLALTAIALGLYLLIAALDWARGELMVVAGMRLDDKLRQRVFDAAMARPGAGAVAANAAQADLHTVRQFISGPALHALFDLPWLPVMALAATLLHPWLGAYVVGATLLLLGLTWLSEWRSAAPLARAGVEGMAAQLSLAETARHAEAVRALGMQAALRERWLRRHLAMLGWQSRASQAAETLGASTRFARMALQSLVFALGAWLVLDADLSAGGIFAVSLIVGRALAPVEQVLNLWRQVVQVRGAWDRLDTLLIEAGEAAERMALPAPTGQISVQQASALAPGGGRPVLVGITCAAMPGDIVGVIGPSGSGKSTLGRLLIGLDAPAAGQVRLDGAEVSQWPREALGPHLGYLPQSVDLLEGTVAENIARFGPVDADKVVAAARSAGVHDLILKLPHGYDTPLGADGSGLSGGQKQRVALARALYGEPRLLVLDEPNANLDADGEAALHTALIGMKARGATVFVITQRNGVLGLADKLLVLQEGAALAFGPKQEVLARFSATPVPVNSVGAGAAGGPAGAAARPPAQAAAGA
ncbi:type I secretion system permease/ATPase [Ideonella sp. DXS29W]|uniref:Type I secretion system permease/ATPase n=1 Tax=Ideonella lacteola TaxID=2984193 RepID=A0ABU9BJL8_9BURK